MPIPLLFIGFSVATGALGIGKGVEAGINIFNANNINKDANELIKGSTDRLNAQRTACGHSLNNLGAIKLYVLNTSIDRFLNTFQKIKNVDFRETEGLDELKNMHIDKKDFEELKTVSNFAGSLAGGAIAGTAGGALTALGAYGAVHLLATASTGTAIATLSGAAATNATLAFLGGGSLAAGGLGIAGGTAVLGGLVAGPALMVMGFVAGGAARKQLDQANTNKAEALQISTQMDKGSLQCEAIRRRTYMFYNLLARLDTYFYPLIYQMEEIVAKEGDDYRLYTLDSKKLIASCASTAVSVKTVLDTPILTEDGLVTEKSAETANSVKEFLDKMKIKVIS